MCLLVFKRDLLSTELLSLTTTSITLQTAMPSAHRHVKHDVNALDLRAKELNLWALQGCGHDLFCFSCVGGLLTCPLCREPIVALHPRGNHHIPAPETVLPKLNTTASSYHLWNWVPGASV
jgi:hypothetical protein